MAISEESNLKLKSILDALGANQKLVFISGNFNIIHPGHQRLLTFAKEFGDFLAIGVNSDENSGVMFPQETRVLGIEGLSCVDAVIPLKEGELLDVIKTLKPNFVLKGKEHEGRENPEEEIVKKYSGKMLFGSGHLGQSSLEMIAKDFEGFDKKQSNKPLEYLSRHCISYHNFNVLLGKFSTVKAIVIGDTIVDRYITCDPLGLSQEDPTIVVSPRLTKQFIGGAGIVACHAQSLGANVKFYSVLGKDETASYVQNYLKESGVESRLFEDESRPTSLKERFRTNEKTLLRVSHLKQHSIDNELISEMLESLREDIPKADILIFSDFNYGCLPQRLVDEICTICKENGVKMVADSQSSSQVGDISRFKDMELITPTEREARLGVGDFESGLAVLCEKLREKCYADNIFITLASDGLLINAHDIANLNGEDSLYYTDRLKAFNNSPKDTAGAGDSLFVTASLALAAGANIWESAYMGALAAAVQVGRLGNFPLKTQDLKTESLIL